MPVVCRFYGIVIRMYFQQAEHNPPHIHALYGEDVAAIAIGDGTVLDGGLPPEGALYGARMDRSAQNGTAANVGDAGVHGTVSP